MEVYVKDGRRYKKLGERWEGFPADGIWFVWDGRQNCLLQLSALKGFGRMRYWGAVILASFKEAIAEALIECASESLSPLETAERVVNRVWDSYNKLVQATVKESPEL